MDIPQDMLNVLIGVGILVGAVQCFFGYRIFKVILALVGFVLGAGLAGFAGFALSQNQAVALLAGLVGGLIGAALLVALYFVGVFLIGAWLGVLLGAVLCIAAQSEPVPVILLILGIIGGVIAVVLQKVIIILATSFGGSWSIVTGIAYFTTGAIDPTDPKRLFRTGGSLLYIMLLCWIALGIAGVIVQYKFLPKPSKEQKKPDKQQGPHTPAKVLKPSD
jgi:hypothetical protein